jgi:plastocyanin
MRLSTIAALCAAPLALATAVKTNEGIEVSVQGKDSSVDEVIIIWVNEGGGAATSTVTNTVTVTDASGTSVAAATHSVTVGGDAGLVYTPDTIEAAVGDMVIFTFESANHTATQSAFTSPCVKLDGGKDSGFMPNLNNTVVPAPQMAMQVTVATPIWFYCRQKGHCGKGMTFSINPTAQKTQAMFQQMAIAQNGTGTASPITGGSAVAPPAASSTVAAAAATTAAVAASAATSGIATGSGNVSNGACECSCLCGMAAFPNAAVQGVGAYGGMSGSMPLAAIAA